MVIKYKPTIKLFLILFFAVSLAGCIYIIIRYPLEGEYLLAFPSIALILYAWAYIQKFKIEITDTEIKAKGFLLDKTLKIEDIITIGMYNQALELKTKKRKIKVTTDLENQKDAIAYVLDKLKGRKDKLKLKGDTGLLSEYLT